MSAEQAVPQSARRPIASAEPVARLIVAEIRQKVRTPARPFLVALDGGSGSGKSTLALLIVAELNAVHIQSDDFFAAKVNNHGWAARSDEQRAADAIDWKRLRRDALEPLISGKMAQWQAFDFVLGPGSDGTFEMLASHTVVAPAEIILLDGTYSARPELADIIDFSILVHVPVEERHKRLSFREDSSFLNAWHARWDKAEEHYFTNICPPSRFDLIVRN